MKFATTLLVALWSGIAFAHLVKYSVTTRIHMYPRDGRLTGPTKSSPKCGRAMGWPCCVSSTNDCESSWPVLGSCGSFLQIFPCLSLWWASSNPFVAGICIVFSTPGAPYTLLSVLFLSSFLLSRDLDILRDPHHILSWKGLRYAKGNVLSTS